MPACKLSRKVVHKAVIWINVAAAAHFRGYVVPYSPCHGRSSSGKQPRLLNIPSRPYRALRQRKEAMHVPQRRTTDSSLQSQSQVRRRPTFPHEASTGRPVQDRYPAYEDFAWDKIEEYLKTKWPRWSAYNAKHVNDSWQFEVPELLSEGDRKALQELRDEHLHQRRASVTPER